MINSITLSVMKLSEIQALAKILKLPYVYINEYGQIFGFDVGIYTIATLNQSVSVPVPLVLDCLQLRNLLKEKILTDTITIEWGQEFCPISENADLESMLYKKFSLDSAIARIMKVVAENPIINKINNLEQDEKFLQYISAPADTGSKFWRQGTYIDSVFKGYLSVNKGDKIFLNVREYNIIRKAVLNEYIIQKKKSLTIKLYGVSLKLIR